jgi:hypothetical protein
LYLKSAASVLDGSSKKGEQRKKTTHKSAEQTWLRLSLNKDDATTCVNVNGRAATALQEEWWKGGFFSSPSSSSSSSSPDAAGTSGSALLFFDDGRGGALLSNDKKQSSTVFLR